MMQRIILAALATIPMALALGTGTAHAAPGQNCTPPYWVRGGFGIPIGTRTMCFNPDGSEEICTSLGTTGNGPGSCITYPPAPAPQPGSLIPIGPPPQ
jgi:hypothetical protein